MTTIRVIRTADTFTGKHGNEGRRMRVEVVPDGLDKPETADAFVSLPALERGDGFIRMTPGEYDAQLANTKLASGRREKVIRVLGMPAAEEGETTDRLLIHVGNWPRDVTGCVAVGMRTTEGGVLDSRRALDLLWHVLGGFTAGAKLKVVVEDVSEVGPAEPPASTSDSPTTDD